MTERQRRRIIEKLKAEGGELVAEFDHELLQKQIDGLKETVEKQAEELTNFSTRFAAIESDRDQLRELILRMMATNEGDTSSVENHEIAAVLSDWANGDDT